MNLQEINNLNEKLRKIIKEQFLHELTPEQAGEELKFIDFNDAVKQLKDKYDKGEIKAYCPNVDNINYQGQDYSLCLVLGISEPSEGMNPHGIKHYLSKHTGDLKTNKEPVTIEELIGATKNIKAAYKDAEKKKQIAFNKKKNRIVFKSGTFVYVICLAKDKKEITYLHNLFPVTNKSYINRKKKEYNK